MHLQWRTGDADSRDQLAGGTWTPASRRSRSARCLETQRRAARSSSTRRSSARKAGALRSQPSSLVSSLPSSHQGCALSALPPGLWPWSYPAFEDIFGRAESDVAAAQAARAASLLKTAGLNFRIVELKAGYLNAAVWWFRIALAVLLALAILFVTYAATTPERTMHQKAEPARKAVEGRTSGP
jgi:hypothetical protein